MPVYCSNFYVKPAPESSRKGTGSPCCRAQSDATAWPGALAIVARFAAYVSLPAEAHSP